ANALAAALPVQLRHLWPGQKLLVLVSATKSYAGKGTIDFVRGSVGNAEIQYQRDDSPMQIQFQQQPQGDHDVGVVCLENVRFASAGGRTRCIRCSQLENLVTTSEVTLASPGAGATVLLPNYLVVALDNNDGLLSPDLLNRCLSIHTAPKGDVRDRKCPIGNL